MTDNLIRFPKIPRLSREMVVTEKIDGTCASVSVVDAFTAEQESWPMDKAMVSASLEGRIDSFIFVGSKRRFITPDDDNFEFAAWVRDHANELGELGPGTHHGEWWGRNIQRGYELGERRFSLFNVGRWVDPGMYSSKLEAVATGRTLTPLCCHVVPILYHGEFDKMSWTIPAVMEDLLQLGSRAAPGYMKPEGIVVYHVAGQIMFKKTFEKDEERKTEG